MSAVASNNNNAGCDGFGHPYVPGDTIKTVTVSFDSFDAQVVTFVNEQSQVEEELRKMERKMCKTPGDKALKFLSELQNASTIIKHLDLSRTQNWGSFDKDYLTDEGLLVLPKLASLQSLDLSLSRDNSDYFYSRENKISLEGMLHLSELTQLQKLSLKNMQKYVTTPILVKIAEKLNKSLRELSLSNTAIEAEGFTHLSYLTSLTGLDLSRTVINNSGLASLPPSLEVLDLSVLCSEAGSHTPSTTTADSLAHLARLTNLRELRLHNFNVHGGLHHLAALPSLVSLSLCSCTTMDDTVDLPALSKFPALESLDISSTEITGAGFAEWKATTPPKRLKVLSMNYCQKLTDANILVLSECTTSSLTQVNIDDSAISRDTVKQLCSKFGPNVSVSAYEETWKSNNEVCIGGDSSY